MFFATLMSLAVSFQPLGEEAKRIEKASAELRSPAGKLVANDLDRQLERLRGPDATATLLARYQYQLSQVQSSLLLRIAKTATKANVDGIEAELKASKAKLEEISSRIQKHFDSLDSRGQQDFSVMLWSMLLGETRAGSLVNGLADPEAMTVEKKEAAQFGLTHIRGLLAKLKDKKNS